MNSIWSTQSHTHIYARAAQPQTHFENTQDAHHANTTTTQTDRCQRNEKESTYALPSRPTSVACEQEHREHLRFKTTYAPVYAATTTQHKNEICSPQPYTHHARPTTTNTHRKHARSTPRKHKRQRNEKKSTYALPSRPASVECAQEHSEHLTHTTTCATPTTQHTNAICSPLSYTPCARAEQPQTHSKITQEAHHANTTTKQTQQQTPREREHLRSAIPTSERRMRARTR